MYMLYVHRMRTLNSQDCSGKKMLARIAVSVLRDHVATRCALLCLKYIHVPGTCKSSSLVTRVFPLPLSPCSPLTCANSHTSHATSHQVTECRRRRAAAAALSFHIMCFCSFLSLFSLGGTTDHRPHRQHK